MKSVQKFRTFRILVKLYLNIKNLIFIKLLDNYIKSKFLIYCQSNIIPVSFQEFNISEDFNRMAQVRDYLGE